MTSSLQDFELHRSLSKLRGAKLTLKLPAPKGARPNRSCSEGIEQLFGPSPSNPSRQLLLSPDSPVPKSYP
ncbi:hypothetical protein [Desulfitobacterium dichloroeliminans]|uniref:hypothetical protein n=1 Tax=Desulfitobacterium dichloroeliminans TaxID=233055 RepID=UPI00155B3B36|nr:hypothetical protein [Desulfitobacterium dichloroeliminans]